MTKVYDLTYLDQGLFTAFIPNTKEGEQAWNELANVTEGTGKVPTIQTKQFIYQLKKAGYSVGKAKPVKVDIESLFDELDKLI